MMYAEITDGIITGVYSTRDPKPEWIAVPRDFQGVVGQRVSELDANWHLRPVSELIADGLVTPPEGQKINATRDGFDPLTRVERITAGLDKLPSEMKIESGELVPKTQEELLAEGVITPADYDLRVVKPALRQIDTESVRALREVVLALASGEKPSAEAITALVGHEASAEEERTKLKAKK